MFLVLKKCCSPTDPVLPVCSISEEFAVMGMKGKLFASSLMRKESHLGFDFCGLCMCGTANSVFKVYQQPFFWGILLSVVQNMELNPKEQTRGHA